MREMSEDFEIREEELKFIAQPYLFKQWERCLLSPKLTLRLHLMSCFRSEVTLPPDLDLHTAITGSQWL